MIGCDETFNVITAQLVSGMTVKNVFFRNVDTFFSCNAVDKLAQSTLHTAR